MPHFMRAGGLVSATSLVLLAACDYELRPPSALSGVYEIEPGCTLTVDDVHASASCDEAGLQASVTIEDERVTVEQVVQSETLTHTECWLERSCTWTTSGSFARKSQQGSDYDGLFSQLGGSWEGTLTVKASCDKETPQPNPAAWCSGGDVHDQTYTVTVDVTAHGAAVSWSEAAGAEGQFEALETQGGVRVADTYYPNQELAQ